MFLIDNMGQGQRQQNTGMFQVSTCGGFDQGGDDREVSRYWIRANHGTERI